MKQLLILGLILISFVDLLIAQESKTTTLSGYLKPAKWRNIGPFRGGRSVCASGVPGDPLTYYMGTTGGGLWKTDDAGQRWKNISDGFFKTGSVGAIVVSKSDPNILYCGMGEHAPRGVMTSHGDGVYKSIDAGKTWTHIGLAPTQHISRIIVHPKNPDIVFVAAQGALYGPSKERGIYKSTDGGATWKNTLYVNDLTGCAELSMDINTPNVMYAAMWEHQRKPWKVISGGNGSGLYKSTDYGETWTKLEKGLPKEMGKMAIAVSGANSDKVYALIESDSNQEKGGLFVSNNAGTSWSRVSKDHRLVQRAWYYIEVFPDPNDENTLYVLSAPALKSIDGGKSWTRITGTHGDYHDLWINPENSKNLCIANDGGAAISFNQGKTWSTQNNMPTSQFYRVNVDNHYPYRIYGGQQDNTSIRIESHAVGRRNITAQNWTASAGGESAFLAFNPDNPTKVMGGSYLGTINLLDTEANAGTNVMTAPIQYLGRDAKDMRYRYNWNAPIIWSKHEPGTFYHGSQFLHRTRDMGKSWELVSPDLTRNEVEKQGKGGGPYTNEAVGAENYGTLAYVIESPHEKGVIYTGSDDGYVQVTRNGGEAWTNVTPKGLEECLINAIEVSPHDAGTVYIAATRYKFNDHKPMIYKSSNYGKSWKNITGNIPSNAFTRVVREDEQVKDLLIAGTELGIFASWNGGEEWQSIQMNLPICPITDLIIRHNDVIVATSGRAFWVLDDLELLRQGPRSSMGLRLYKPAKTTLVNSGSPLNSNSATVKGSDPFYGVNPATGAVIYYQLPSLEKDAHVSMKITDESGKTIASFTSKKDKTFKTYAGGPRAKTTLSKKEGLNRFVWNLRHDGMPGIPTAYIEGSYNGHKVIPGKYNIEIISGKEVDRSVLEVLPNPNYNTTTEEYKAYDLMMSEMENNITDMHQMTNRIYKKRMQLEKVNEAIGKKKDSKDLSEQLTKIISKMKSWDEDMVQRRSKAYDDVENFPNKFTANYLFLLNQTESAIPRVNQPNLDRKKELDLQWQALMKRGQDIEETELKAINELLWKNGVGTIYDN